MIYYVVVVFPKDVRGTQLPTACFFYLSPYIFMFNKAILLFHHFFPFSNLLLPMLIQSFVNSNLHVSTLYTRIIPKASEFESLTIVQLQASGTFSIMSIVIGGVSIPQHAPFRLCSCFMNTKFSKILKFAIVSVLFIIDFPFCFL